MHAVLYLWEQTRPTLGLIDQQIKSENSARQKCVEEEYWGRACSFLPPEQIAQKEEMRWEGLVLSSSVCSLRHLFSPETTRRNVLLSTHTTSKMASVFLRRGPRCFGNNKAQGMRKWHLQWGEGGSDKMAERASLPIGPLPKQTQIPSLVFVAPKAYVCVVILDGFGSSNKLSSTLI